MRRAHFASLIAAGAATIAVGPVSAESIPTVHVATIPIDNGAEAYYAQDQGMFAKSGLVVDIRSMNSGPAIVAAVASGGVDIGFSNLFSVITAFSKGIPIVAIAPAALYDANSPAQALLVRKDAPYKSGKDLNGATIAVNGVRGITQITAAAWIDKSGGNASTVKWIEMPDPLMSQALEDRRIDAASAAMSDNPGAGTPASSLRILGYPYEAISRSFLASCWFSSKAWADANPDTARAFARAIGEAGRWANANRNASGPILAKYAKLAPDRMAMLGNNRALYASRPLSAETLASVVDFSATHGVIDKAFPPQNLIAASIR